MPDTQDQLLREHVVYLLDGGGAHAKFDDVVKDSPAKLRGQRPVGLPHSPWMLLEHMRLAQLDILEFSRDPKHESPEWPEGYWPKTPAPPSASAWETSIKNFRKDSRRRWADDSAGGFAGGRSQRLSPGAVSGCEAGAGWVEGGVTVKRF